MRTSICILALATATALAAPASGAADIVPKFDIAGSCKAEVADASGRWAAFAKADKSVWLRETSIDEMPSDVELQICLEMSAGTKAGVGAGK